MTLQLALDLGSSKMVLVAWDAGKCRTVRSISAAVEGRVPSSPDESLWDANWFRNKTVELLHEMAGQIQVTDCVGLAVTGQQHGVVLLDRDVAFRPCSPFISWMDGRGRRRTDATGQTLEEEVRQRLGAVTNGELGCQMATGYAGLTLFELQRQGRVPRSAILVFLTDYINRCLTGTGMPVTDPTMAASSGLFDVRGSRWSDAARSALNLPASLFPDVVAPGTCLGGLGPDVAQATGFPAGLPIVQGWGDHPASIHGVLATCPPLDHQTVPVLINYGTGTQVTVLSSSFRASRDFETRPFGDDRYLLVRAEPSGGRAWVLLRDFFLRVGRDLFHEEPDPNELFHRMNQLAQSDCSPQVVCRPQFFPRRHDGPGHAEKGSFTHLDADHFTPGEMIRALLAGMAEESFGHWQVLRAALGFESRNGNAAILGSGNLFRKNPAFRSFVEKRFDASLLLSEIQEEAAVGTALLLNPERMGNLQQKIA